MKERAHGAPAELAPAAEARFVRQHQGDRFMPRLLETTLWLLSAVLATVFYFVSGFYAWAAILVWTILVLPLALGRRRTASVAGQRWPPRPVIRMWAAALVASLAAGVVLTMVDSSSAAWVGWIHFVLAWVAVLLSATVMVWVTYDRTTRSGAA